MHLLRYIWRGKTFARYSLDRALMQHTIRGKTLDVGGGKFADYHAFMPQDELCDIRVLDMMQSRGPQGEPFDLETMPFPYENNSYQTVIMLNLLEHIFNYQFVSDEAFRVMARGGQLIGFVPFMVNVHRDPHDYFRYTDETLQKILTTSGFKNIRIHPLGKGPCMVGYNAYQLMLPQPLRMLALPLPYCIDSIICVLRPHTNARVPLGYLFTADKI